MIIKFDELSEENKRKYDEFEQEVNTLLEKYQNADPKRFELVQRKLEQKGKNWDGNIELVSGENIRKINVQQLLAYEYGLATERITNQKVSFEEMIDKLFDGVDRFKIGNPVVGEDDEYLYGKGYDDESAIPVTSKKYRVVMNAGAQHIDGIKNGKYSGAVFIYAKKDIPDFFVDEEGNNVRHIADGIDFENISRGQSLLSNLRQTVFHEWNHNAEKEVIDAKSMSIPYEYESADEEKYRNYDKVSEYVVLAPDEKVDDIELVISTRRDERGRRKIYLKKEDGSLGSIHDKNYRLVRKRLDDELCISTGMTTKEILPNGEIQMHNIITEGFVEMIARDMVQAVNPEVQDIDRGKYAEYVEIARKVVEARDKSLGENGRGSTIADFLTRSSHLKRELEEKEVYQSDGTKVDGLHYISNYADDVQKGRTPKRKLLSTLPDLVDILSLSEEQVREIKRLDLWKKKSLSEEDKKILTQKLAGGNESFFYLTEEVVGAYAKTLDDEREFIETIGTKLRIR